MYFRSRQGSVLGRLLFPTYTSPITMITRSIHDTQLFIAINPSVPSSDIIKLTSCLDALQSWLCLNGMALNPDKSDAILLGTESRQRSSCYTSLGFVNVAGSSVPLIHQSSPKIWLRLFFWTQLQKAPITVMDLPNYQNSMKQESRAISGRTAQFRFKFQ